MQRIIAVLDIGKTNIKLCALESSTGETLAVVKRSNSVLHVAPYPQVDVEGIWSWYCAELKKLSAMFTVESLCCTTHGATVACLSGDSLAFPIVDYESDLCEQSNHSYAAVRPAYSETLSPALGVGLNAARQLFWLSESDPEQFKKVDTILMYPQYWAWRLSGVRVSEVTSLGCHTDLWQPKAGEFSSLLERLGWTNLFPALFPAGQSLGPVREGLRCDLGLPDECQVINGIHDSNASLVPYLVNEAEPFTVISSGTWVVIASIGGADVELSEDDDMLANVNVFDKPVPTIRFMGGREWEILRGEEVGGLEDLQRVLQSDVLLKPCFVNQGGPFRHLNGEFVGPIDTLNASERATLASLYCALVADFCLSRIGSQGKVIVEGSFASNPVFLTVLQILRQGQNINISHDTTGTTIGAARLIDGCEWSQKALMLIDTADSIDAALLIAYRELWRELLSTRM